MNVHPLRVRSRALVLIIAVCGLIGSAGATPYWTPEQVAEQQRLEGSIVSQPPPRHRATLDEDDYFAAYVRLCNFLAGLQHDGSPPGGPEDIGGMREGEVGGDLGIVQTDNTQEAIRAWSLYGLWTGDTATYSANIRAAWQYCGNYPAWFEEGGAGGYYQIHNCGWGIEAAMMYARAYADTSMNWYADSCCWRVRNHTLGNGNLDLCALGLGIGGLYPWGVERGRQDWQEFAVEEARRLRAWFEESPSRLNNVNTWALCGGTALWGVCQSLFTLYPDSGASWLNTYGEQIEDWRSQGSWFNSYNTWYSNATFRAWQITDDPLYWERGLDFAANLLEFDVDEDGGIPPGDCCIEDSNDHSWVSAYMGWMAFSYIVDAGGQIVSPDPNVPHLAGVPLEVTVEVWNPLTETALRAVNVIGFGLDETQTITLGPGESELVTLETAWMLPDDDTLPSISTSLTATVWTEGADPSDSATIVAEYDIRRQVELTGTVRGEFDVTEMPESRIEFYHEDLPDYVWVPYPTQSGEFFDSGDQPLMAGLNRVRVIPPLRYVVLDTVLDLQAGGEPNFVELWLTTTQIALVDDDHGGESGSGIAYDSYVSDALENIGYVTRVWDQELQVLQQADHVSVIVWITGDDAETTLEPDEQAFVQSFVSGGGALLLSGQNIVDDLWTDPFLLNTLACTPVDSNTGVTRVYGVEGDPAFGGERLLLLGNTGAANQTSTASMQATEDSDPILAYMDPAGETAGVMRNLGEGKLMFLGFGIEAIGRINGWLFREDFLTLALQRLEVGEAIGERTVGQPQAIYLHQNYPNPFNPTTTLTFAAPRGVAPVTLTVYDLLGRRVTSLYRGTGSGHPVTIHWDGTTESGTPAAGGTYFCSLRAGEITKTRTLQLLR